MYPMLEYGVSMGTFRYHGSETIHYYIENSNGDEFELSYRVWRALWQADGTKPLKLPHAGRELIPQLKKNGLIRTSRYVREDNSFFSRLILLPFGSVSKAKRQVCKAINAALSAASMLIFALAVLSMVTSNVQTGDDFVWWLYCCLILCSIGLHEVGHIISGLAYGYKIKEAGVLLVAALPVGAYVSAEENKNTTRHQMVQFSLAGIEMNLLVAGICLLVASFYYPLSFTLVCVANVNVQLAIVNSFPVAGLDGHAALSDLCGVEDISNLSKKVLLSRMRRNRLLRYGMKGYVLFCLLAFVLISKALFVLVIGSEIIVAFLHFV